METVIIKIRAIIGEGYAKKTIIANIKKGKKIKRFQNNGNGPNLILGSTLEGSIRLSIYLPPIMNLKAAIRPALPTALTPPEPTPAVYKYFLKI